MKLVTSARWWNCRESNFYQYKADNQTLIICILELVKQLRNNYRSTLALFRMLINNKIPLKGY